MMQPIGVQGYPQAAPSASAVNIQIFEPKAYGSAASQAPMQNGIYNYPAQSMYTQPYANQYQQFMPQQAPVYQAPMMQTPMYQAPAEQTPTQPVAPQEMPAPVLNAVAPAPEAAAQAPADQQVQPQTPDANAQQATPEAQPVSPDAAQNTQQAPDVNVVAPTQPDQTGVDVNALVEGLKSTDNKVQEDAITKIANYSQGSPDMQNAVLNEPVMKGLVDIIKQDTSGLQGPTEAQTAAINKKASGVQLTPEEEALTNEMAPKTLADKNKIISMFTLAMLQKNQRDEVDRYNQAQDPNNQLPQLKINDLMGYNEIENAARNDNEKEVKLAALQALAYVAKPEDKPVLEPVLNAALQDSEPLIQQAANEVLTNIGGTPAADTNAKAEAKEAPKSKKELRAEKKAAKKAAKEAAKNPEKNNAKVA